MERWMLGFLVSPNKCVCVCSKPTPGLSPKRLDDCVNSRRTISASPKDASSISAPSFLFPNSFFICNLIFLSISSPLLFRSTLIPPMPHLSRAVTDPSGNCFETARHFCVVAVYLCWGAWRFRGQVHSPFSAEVKPSDSLPVVEEVRTFNP